jgi:putative sterol carrier protein
MSAADYVELATGRLSAQMAFMTGRLRLAGDMSLAEKVQPLLRVT